MIELQANTPLIIAEAGVNHGGSFAKAKKYVEMAKFAGADYIKFHAAYADRMVSPEKHNKLWADRHELGAEPMNAFVKRVELTMDEMRQLKSHAEGIGIRFMLSCYDQKAIEDAIEIGVTDIKLASCDIIKDDYIRYLNRHAELIVLATGMATMDEIEHAMEIADRSKTYLLHCISEYPMPPEHANLRFIQTLKDRFGEKVGFSDHTPDILIPALAVFQGAEMVEKHFMLEEDTDCCDANVSVFPDRLKTMTHIMKSREKIIGSGTRVMSETEAENREKFRYRWK